MDLKFLLTVTQMHTNFFSFSAKTHFDLGKGIGETFRPQAREVFEKEVSKSSWGKRKRIANQLLPYALQYFPRYVDELRGYSVGANISFSDFWVISLEDDVPSSGTKSSAKCTTIVTSDGFLIGHNEDQYSPGLENSICVVKKTINDFSTLEIFYFNTLGGNSVGCNSYGYIHSVNTLLYTQKQIGLPKNFIARFLLDTNNPGCDIDTLKNMKRASGYNHTIISDRGHVLNVECTSKQIKMRKPTLPFVHTNHRLIGGRTSVLGRDIYGTSSRLQVAQRKVKRLISEQKLQNILGDTSIGKDKSIFNERTIARITMDVRTRKMNIWLLREKDEGWVTYSY